MSMDIHACMFDSLVELDQLGADVPSDSMKSVACQRQIFTDGLTQILDILRKGDAGRKFQVQVRRKIGETAEPLTTSTSAQATAGAMDIPATRRRSLPEKLPKRCVCLSEAKISKGEAGDEGECQMRTVISSSAR